MDTILNARLAHYAQSHRDRRNEVIHCVCVPAILFAVIGLLTTINLVLAIVAIGLALVYYARLGKSPALRMALVMLSMLVIWVWLVKPLLGTGGAAWFAVLLFVLAWIGQFVGHYYEGRKPSFFEDLQYLLIGPLFVIAVLTRTVPNPAP
jgi:uncharacterized membrane protein YGL010W